jgi:hypothetical protein
MSEVLNNKYCIDNSYMTKELNLVKTILKRINVVMEINMLNLYV